MGKNKSIEFVKLMVQLRNTKNLTQSELADLLNVSRSTIAKIESLENKPTNKMVQNFIEHFKDDIKQYGFDNIYILSDENVSFKTIFSTIKEKVKDFFEEIDDTDFNNLQNRIENPNSEFKKNMERLAFLERENDILKGKIEMQEKFINQLINNK